MVSQLYLKNCALATLSRIGMLDNLQARQVSISSADGGTVKDSSWDIIDALHLCGAPTVLFPLWGGGSMGGDVGQFARILLILRFYYELPSYAHYHRAVAKALQIAQVRGLCLDQDDLSDRNGSVSRRSMRSAPSLMWLPFLPRSSLSSLSLGSSKAH
jgi:hypothetical protein